MAQITTNFMGTMWDRAFDDLLRWIVVAALTVFGAVILWDYGFIDYVVVSDHTYVSQLIMALFAVASGWVLWQLWDLSLELRSIEGIVARLEADGDALPRLVRPDHDRGARVEAFVSDVIRARTAQADAGTDAVLAAASSELRAPVRLGIYFADALYKLGILGTVIGFILMLAAFRDLGQFDPVTLRDALQDMTAGMAISLLTTIVGIATGMLLRVQVNILDSLSLRIGRRLVRVADVMIPSLLARRHV